SKLGCDSGSNETVSRGGGLDSAAFAAAAAPAATAVAEPDAAALFVAPASIARVDFATSCSAPARIAAGVFASGATPDVGESEISSSSVKSMPLSAFGQDGIDKAAASELGGTTESSLSPLADGAESCSSGAAARAQHAT